MLGWNVDSRFSSTITRAASPASSARSTWSATASSSPSPCTMPCRRYVVSVVRVLRGPSDRTLTSGTRPPSRDQVEEGPGPPHDQDLAVLEEEGGHPAHVRDDHAPLR